MRKFQKFDKGEGSTACLHFLDSRGASTQNLDFCMGEFKISDSRACTSMFFMPGMTNDLE